MPSLLQGQLSSTINICIRKPVNVFLYLTYGAGGAGSPLWAWHGFQQTGKDSRPRIIP